MYSFRKLLAPALCCVAVGLLISLLPVLLLLKNGHPAAWIADSDELLYLAVAAQSYFGSPFHLADPILQGHAGRSMFPWIQFAPGILPRRSRKLHPRSAGHRILLARLRWRLHGAWHLSGHLENHPPPLDRRAACTTWMLSGRGHADWPALVPS